TALLGFPLYFMDQAQAKAAVQKIMDDFGEVNGVYGKPETENRITAMHLFQNAPNPFNKQTSIKYQLPKAGRVRLNIYNIAGQLVKTLVNKDQPAGSYTLSWDRKDNHNKQVSAGVYIYYLSTGDKSQSRKMIVLK
ncbi:MAG: T9SS type A sorting domain-containing protein, partial [Candidatus Edwardsbacteria bacterium]|nr:T9SS type A sorting domain-containing protein [Candidatus Edwardsbacteria bacterium]